MADSVRLSLTPSVSEQFSSSHDSSFTYPVNSDDELQGPGPVSCDTWLNPGQVACQHISDHLSATSGGSRSPALSHGHSDDGDQHGPIEDSALNVREASTDSDDEESQIVSTGGYSRVTKSPQQATNFRPGKLPSKFRNHPHSQSETVIEPPKSANVLKLWKWEISNCVLACGMLGSMYSILLHYDGHRIPDWGTAINLSTLIALMATLLRTMLAFVVSEIIGQAKWDYFAGGVRPKDPAPVRRLIETSRFNEASQGMLGAVKLLPTIILDPATLTAVMVMIVSLGTGSFVQQAIQTQSCQFPVDSARASLPVSRNLTTQSISTGFGSSELYAAISSALSPDSEEIGSPIAVGCPTGNCTFRNSIGGVYSTLGTCSSCADTSSLITSTKWTSKCDPDEILCITSTANYTLPNGMSIQASFGEPSYPHLQKTEMLASPELDLNWTGNLSSPEMVALSQWALANVTIFGPNWLPTNSGYSEYVAATCTLYPCLRSYTGSVISGKLDEVLISTIPIVPNVAYYFLDKRNITTPEDVQEELSREDNDIIVYNLQAVKSPCLVNDIVWTKENKSSTLDLQRLFLAHAIPDPGGAPRFEIENITAPTECIYDLEQMTAYQFSQMADSFKGSCNVSGLRIDSPENGTMISCGETYWLASFLADKGPTAASIIERIEAFTDRLSNKMRMGLYNKPEIVYGQVLQATVCSRIHYSWLAFPSVLVAITSGLLAWTMFRSARSRGRVMVWKTSILPFLFYGERFVVQNGEDVSAVLTESLRRDEGAKEPLLDLDQMETEARQRKVRFDMFN